MDAKTWKRILGNDGTDTIKPALPGVLQTPDGTDKEIVLTAIGFVMYLAKDPYCAVLANTAGKA